MFAHSAANNSGAISLARRRTANASDVPSSSTTHFTTTLASMTSVFTAPRVLRGAIFPRAFASFLLSAYASRRPASRKKFPPRWQGPGEESPGAQPRPNGHGVRRDASTARSGRHRGYAHADFRPFGTP